MRIINSQEEFESIETGYIFLKVTIVFPVKN